MLAALGANREALEVARERPWLFWRRSMRGVLSEPDFPTVANQLGLMTYWKTTRIKPDIRSEEHTSELQSLMRISYAVFCLKKKNNTKQNTTSRHYYNMKFKPT